MKKFAATISAVAITTTLLSPLAFADGLNNSGDGNNYTSANTDTNAYSNINWDANGPFGNWTGGHPHHNKGHNVKFQDLSGYSWAAAAIQLLGSEGIVRGMNSAGTEFAPGQAVTREQFATMMEQYFGLPLNTSPVSFIDVPQGRWSYDYVEAAAPYMDYYQTLAGGYAFNPTKAMSREDVAVTIVKILEKQGVVTTLPDQQTTDYLLSSFVDEQNVAGPARPYVAEAVALGLLKGEGYGEIAPLQGVNRAEAAEFLSRIDQNQLVIPGSTSGSSGVTVTTGGTTSGSTSTGTTTSTTGSSSSSTGTTGSSTTPTGTTTTGQ